MEDVESLDSEKEPEKALEKVPESSEDCSSTSEISEEAIDQIIGIIDENPDQAKVQLQLIKQQISLSSWSAPLPRPAEFGEYGKYVADAPERILQMTEKEQRHRHKMEAKIAKASIRKGKRKMSIQEKDSDWERKMQLISFLMAFVLALAFLISATYLLVSGIELGGFVSLAAGLALLIGPFIYWRTKANKSNKPSKPNK